MAAPPGAGRRATRRVRPPALRDLGLAAALLFIALATLTPDRESVVGSGMLCIICGEVGGVDAVLNVLLFVPLGLALGVRGCSGRRAAAMIVLLTVSIELLQLSEIPGRDSSLGDVVMNTIGGLAGYAAGVSRARWLRPTPSAARWLTACAIGAWLGIQLVTAWALVPELDPRPDAPTPRRGGPALEGTFPVTLVPGELPPYVTPLHRTMDGRARELFMLGRRQDAIVVRARTRAARLRLRRPMFIVDPAMPAAQNGMRSAGAIGALVDVRVYRDRLAVTARTAQGEHRQDVRFSASWGWLLVLPFTLLVPGPLGTTGTVLWIAALLVPVGYWGFLAAVGAPALRRVALGAAIPATALLLGLLFAPLAMGLHPSPLTEWIAGALGLLAGGVLAALSSAAGELEHRLPLRFGHRLNRKPAPLPQQFHPVELRHPT